MSDDKLVDYGYGRVQPHPIPERQRPVVNDNPEIQNTRDAAAKEIVDGENIRARARELETGGRPYDIRAGAARAVRIKMPSGSIALLGGEALVMALANGGQPMDEPRMQPTVNGQVAGLPAPRVHFLE